MLEQATRQLTDGGYLHLKVQQEQPVLGTLGTTDGSGAPDGGVKGKANRFHVEPLIRSFIPVGQFVGTAGLLGLEYLCRTVGELRVLRHLLRDPLEFKPRCDHVTGFVGRFVKNDSLVGEQHQR